MSTFLKKMRRSWFGANKIHLFLLMLFLALANLSLALIGTLMIFLLYLHTILRARLPIDPGGTFTSETRVYRRAGGNGLKIDIYYPKKAAEMYPVVFFSHGGGWISGFRNQPNNISWCRFLASKGFAAVSIDYRFGITSTMDEILSDYSAALDYIRDNSLLLHLDKGNIILMGLSAGGHLALLFSAYYTYSRNAEKTAGLRGVAAWYAPSYLEDIFSPEDKSIFARVAAAATMKGTPKTDAGIYRYYSPSSWVSERMIPTLIVHGREDSVVPFRSSENLTRLLQNTGVPCRFMVHKDGGHGFETRRKDLQTTRILTETVRWMRRLLRHEN